MYQKVVVYYMTGTGNSYKIAKWSAHAADENGIGSDLVQVRAAAERQSVPPQALAVFTYPTHGFTSPWLMMKYVLRLEKGEKRHAVVLPTRAGMRVKSVFIPGLEGTAGYLIALLLWLKDYSVRCIMGVDMPSNWTAVHWGMSEENATVITSFAESKVKSMLYAVMSGRKHYDGVVQLSLGLVLAKLSLMYLILAQLILAKLFFASDKCNGCLLCQSICPKKALKMRGIPKRPYWTYACDSCMACMNFCPQKAIEVSPIIITLFYYITSVPFIAYMMHYSTEWYGLNLEAIPLLGFAIQYCYILLAIAISYYFIHFSFGSRLIRTVTGKLSHTRYFRRYKAPGVSLGDIYPK